MSIFAPANGSPEVFSGSSGQELHAYNAAWVEHPSSTNTAVCTGSDYAKSNSSIGVSFYYYNVTPPSADYEVQCDVKDTSSAATYLSGPAGRISSSANTMYYVRWNNSSGKWELIRRVSGTDTVIGSYTASVSNGSTYTVLLSMSGTTISVSVNGTQIISVTDSSISAAGFAGVFFQISTVSEVTNWQAIQPTTPQSVSDSATGSETAAVAATEALSDSATGSDAAAVAATEAASDSGAGSETVGVASPSAAADSATGAETITTEEIFSPTDAATGSDAAAVAATEAASDSAAGSETVGVTSPEAASDTATGSETASVAITPSATDEAAGTDSAHVEQAGNSPVIAPPNGSPDAFNAPSGTELHAYNADWVEHPSSGATAIINTDAWGTGVLSASDTSPATYFYNIAPATPDYAVAMTLVKVEGGYPSNAYLSGPAIRMSPTADTMYFARYDWGATAWQLVKRITGTSTVIGSYSASEPAAGTVVQITAIGSTISLLVNGTQVISVTNTAISAAGFGGMRLQETENSSAQAGATAPFTDWQATQAGTMYDNAQGSERASVVNAQTESVMDSAQGSDSAAIQTETIFAPANGSPDTFTAASNTDLHVYNPDWVEHPDSLVSGFVEGGLNEAWSNDTDKPATYFYNIAPAAADYDVQLDSFMYGTPGATYPRLTGPALRMSPTADTMYYGCFNHATGAWEIVKRVAGAETVIGSYADNPSGTYTLKLSARGQVISLTVNNGKLISVTDSGIADAGYPGMYLGGYSFSAAENWSAIELATPQRATDSATGSETGAVDVAPQQAGTDSASGSESAFITEQKAGTDSASGSESATVATGTDETGADSATGSESVNVASNASQQAATDSATGQESATVGEEDFTPRDQAAGTDAAAISATESGADQASGADAASISEQFGATDQATGADNNAIIKWAPPVSQMRDSSRIKPAYLVQITLNGGGPTLYFSDRNIVVGTQRYEDYLKDLSGIGNEILRATSTGRNTDITLTFKNDKFQAYNYLIEIGDTFPFEAAVCQIYETYFDDNGNPAQPVLLFKGILDQPSDIDLFIFKCKVSMMPYFMDRRWRQTLVTLTRFPEVYEDTGKYLPIVYGENVLLPAVRTNWGARTTLVDAITSGQTTLALSDPTRFPASGAVCIDHEIITYSSISTINLEGLGRGTNGTSAEPHRAGAEVWQYQPTYDSIIAAHALSGITYIFAEYQGKLWLVTSGVTSSVDANGCTHLSFGQYLYVDGLLDYIGVNGALGINDDGHTHVPTPANPAVEIFNPTSLPMTQQGNGSSTTQLSFAISLPALPAGTVGPYVYKCTVDYVNATNGFDGPYFVVNGTTYKFNMGTTFEVQLSSYVTSLTVYVNWSGTSPYYLDGTFILRSISVTAKSAAALTSQTSNTSLNGGPATKTGEAIETHLIERLHAFVNGYQDDASGTYTGVPNSVIQTPEAVIKHFLCVPSGGVFNAATDFDAVAWTAAKSAYAGYVSGGYKMGFVLDSLIKPSQFVQKLAFECRSTLTYDRGQWHLNPIPDVAPAAIRTIDQKDLAGKNAMFKFGKTDWKNIWNDICLNYCKQYSRVNIMNSDWLGSLEVQDAGSQSLYGVMVKTDLELDCIRDQATAQSVLNHILLEAKNPNRVVEFDTFWENFDLSVGQTIAIANDLWNGKLFFIQNITRKDQKTAHVKAIGWWS